MFYSLVSENAKYRTFQSQLILSNKDYIRSIGQYKNSIYKINKIY